MEILSRSSDIDEVNVGYKPFFAKGLVRKLQESFDPGTVVSFK